jgi:hypothetical protein
MLLKHIAAAGLGLMLLAPAAAPQTVSEQLQKGIYAQDTAGDLEGAIAIYKQIVGSGQASRQNAATAQFRLAQALLQKGDLEGAAREFQALSALYPDQKEAIAALATRVGPGQPRLTLGTMHNGRYVHALTGVQLIANGELKVVQEDKSSDDGEMVVLGKANEIAVAVWLKPEVHAPSELAALVKHDLENKPTQRPAGWKVRPESVRTGGGTDRQWVTAIADFTQNGIKAVELVTWYRTPKVHAFFFAPMAEQMLAQNQERFRVVWATAVIP